MEEKKPFDHAFTFKDDLSVREIFADGIHGIQVGGGVAKLTFTASRMSEEMKLGHKGPPKGYKAPVARIAFPAPAFADLYNKMNQLMAAMEAQGLVKREAGGVAKATMQ